MELGAVPPEGDRGGRGDEGLYLEVPGGRLRHNDQLLTQGSLPA